MTLVPTPPSTEDVIGALKQALVKGNKSALSFIYSGSELAQPEIMWLPTVGDLSQPELKFLLSYWQRLRGAAGIPHQDQIDAADMWLALGYIMLLDVVDDGRDFRYRVYGSKIADRSKIDMTGKLLSDFAIAPLTRSFFIAGYRAVMERREPLVTVHAHAPGITIASTTRLILPLVKEAGTVSRLLVGNIPGAWRSSD
jgi:hypothetical protein